MGKMVFLAFAWALGIAGGCAAIFDTDGLRFGDDEIDWVEIPGGTFTMGEPGALEGWSTYPAHDVSVPAFEIARTETTVAQYAMCVEAGACDEPGGESSGWSNGIALAPLNGVSWSQAAAFCEWAGGRLPSEAEWEFAARGTGGDVTYPWGDEAPTCDNVIMAGSDAPEAIGCGTGYPWPVCSRRVGDTAQGLCDMAGNLLEWTQDRLHHDYVGAPSDGSAWETTEDSADERILRGGDLHLSDPGMFTVFVRFEWLEDAHVDQIGFRCAR